MSISDLLSITASPVLSVIIWFVILSILLYIARNPMHRGLLSVSRMLHRSMRVGAKAVHRAETSLQQRNREVLLAAGREASERIIEREFDRIDATVQRELAEYPALHRKLSEAITAIDEDYIKSKEVPPSPPGWVKAVEAVAEIPAKSDAMVGQVLENIHKSLMKAEGRALDAYRKASGERHRLLKKAMPHWRQALRILNGVGGNINSLLDRAKTIDRHMDEYENIVRGTDRAQRMLSSSSLVQFFVSAFVLAIAIGGAIINFNLIARPMSEMVGGTNMIGNFKIADIAALVIILIEISIGLFLMESLRITRLFPVIGALHDKMRVRMIWITFSFLFALASVEAGLAFMREILMQDELATSALLRGEDAASYQQPSFLWITTAAQMGMGFILPFALTFVAIPLETFIHSLRTVLGMILTGALRALATTLRVLGNLFRSMGKFSVDVYDILIFGPLWIESAIKGRLGSKNTPGATHKAGNNPIEARGTSL
ncbi:MAG: hypothetical protein MJA83_07970 [Gammaproteobacteria bacterium]|nr:hypothetical protein [Gammaproteobacteria bacterium]